MGNAGKILVSAPRSTSGVVGSTGKEIARGNVGAEEGNNGTTRERTGASGANKDVAPRFGTGTDVVAGGASSAVMSRSGRFDNTAGISVVWASCKIEETTTGKAGDVVTIVGVGRGASSDNTGPRSDTTGAIGNTTGAIGDTIGASCDATGASGDMTGASGEMAEATGDMTGARGSRTGASGVRMGTRGASTGAIDAG